MVSGTFMARSHALLHDSYGIHMTWVLPDLIELPGGDACSYGQWTQGSFILKVSWLLSSSNSPLFCVELFIFSIYLDSICLRTAGWSKLRPTLINGTVETHMKPGCHDHLRLGCRGQRGYCGYREWGRWYAMNCFLFRNCWQLMLLIIFFQNYRSYVVV